MNARRGGGAGVLSAGGGAWAKSHLLLVEEGGISRAQAHEAVSRRGAGS